MRRARRIGDEEKEEERENQDGSRKERRQEIWTMMRRKKSRGSPSGCYRSAQKRLIKSFREVKKE